MSNFDVTERRLRPIRDAVANRNWKQALQQCEKWQKKGENSDRFLALKASILVNQPDKSQFEKGKTETVQLCHRDPAVTDVEALYQLQDTLKHLSLLHQEGPKLWERAIAARPADKDLLTTLLNGSISDDNWMSAQKAAMALRKAFPKERQYEFWNILLCYLIHQDDALLHKDRELFGRLAYRLMSKAAESASANKEELLTTGRAISTPEELSLLVRIYIATGYVDEAVRALQSDHLGPGSRLAELDPQFVFSLLLDTLNASKNTAEVLDTCTKLLSPSSSNYKQNLEDDRIWKIIKDIGTGKNNSRHEDDACLDLARSTYKAERSCRAAYLTFLDLAIDKLARGEQDLQEQFVSACVAYYEVFSERPFCFDDLVCPLLAAGLQARDSFRSRVTLADGTDMQQIFALKLRYACLDADEQYPINEYLILAADAVRLHKRLPQHKPECAEIILVAAMTLLKLAVKRQDVDFAVQANYMMENAYATFNEYYPLAIRQVQLYLVQGQGSLAMEKFATLAVKNIQWETVGHLLLTRISTLHPWQSGTGEYFFNPLGALDAGLAMLESSDQALEKAVRDGLKYGSYSNIIDSVEVRSRMARSMNRQIFVVEERRIKRLAGVSIDSQLAPYPAKMVDQRDFSFLQSYDGGSRTSTPMEEYLTGGPLPREIWLRAMALHDHLVTYLKAELASQSSLAASTFDQLKPRLEKVRGDEGQFEQQLTTEEHASLECHRHLVSAVLLLKDGPAIATTNPSTTATATQTDIDSIVEEIESWIDSTEAPTMLLEAGDTITTATTVKINDINTPTWKFLHASLTQLESLQTISHFLSLQARKTKTPSKSGKNALTIPKTKITSLQQKVTEAEKAVHDRAKTLKDGLNAPGVLGKLVEVASGRIEPATAGEKGSDEHNKNISLVNTTEYKDLGEAYADLVDEAKLEEYCGRMKESWEDALDGVLRVKVKMTK